MIKSIHSILAYYIFYGSALLYQRYNAMLTIPYIVCVYCPSGTLEAAIVLPPVLLLRQRKYGRYLEPDIWRALK